MRKFQVLPFFDPQDFQGFWREQRVQKKNSQQELEQSWVNVSVTDLKDIQGRASPLSWKSFCFHAVFGGKVAIRLTPPPSGL